MKIRGALCDELLAVRARRQAGPDEPVFGTRNGRSPGRENIRNRVLKPTIDKASKDLTERGLTPLPEGLALQSLRRTFASVLCAIGEDPGMLMDELGHTDASFSVRVYRQAMRRDEGEKQRLRDLVDGVQLAVIGSRADSDAFTANDTKAA